VLLLPDGQRHSLPMASHWFLRGAPYLPPHAASREFPREFFVELQHFDLSGQVVHSLPRLEEWDPVVMLWDTHDQKTVLTHGLVFETRVGQGRLFVSALRHDGEENPAGRYLLNHWLRHLESGPAPKHALATEAWDYLKQRIHAEETNLVNSSWSFRPDPGDEGLQQGWHLPTVPEGSSWTKIRIGNYWESQGFPALDKWAWYRLSVGVPQKWEGSKVFLSFEGVDDMYELYVNGQFVAKVGDIGTRQDALGKKTSHDITAFVKPGQQALLAVRVYDWYGAGGIYRPVTLGTRPFRPDLDVLK
jgi:hypothetical protein